MGRELSLTWQEYTCLIIHDAGLQPGLYQNFLAKGHLGFMSFQVCAHFASCSSAADGRQRNISNDDDE